MGYLPEIPPTVDKCELTDRTFKEEFDSFASRTATQRKRPAPRRGRA